MPFISALDIGNSIFSALYFQYLKSLMGLETHVAHVALNSDFKFYLLLLCVSKHA